MSISECGSRLPKAKGEPQNPRSGVNPGAVGL